MQEISGELPVMWGESIIGFGSYDYVYPTGRKGTWFLVGFSPRKQNMTVYLMAGVEVLEPELSSIGKHKLGKGCLYFKKNDDIDLKILRTIIEKSIQHLKNQR